jgi:pyruvate kinase
MRRSKIVATLGPATESPEMIRELLIRGVNVFRMNMSHAEHDAVRDRIKNIRSLSEQLGRHVAILADIQGPKIRLGNFKKKQVMLEQGQIFTLDLNPEDGDEKRVNTTYQTIYKDVKAGDRILVDDGKLDLKVKEVKDTSVITEVIVGGPVSNHKGMNLPSTKISLPALTNKDLEDVKFVCEEDFDYIALSFVRKASDVNELREILKKNRRNDIHIISKIEKPEALVELDRIIELSDAIMIARGDLGVEVGPEKVPILQKKIINKCNKSGRPVITATQMLESMMGNPRPTRAEASDIANAIWDGTDAVMLSGETAMGDYALETVEMMDKIITETESEIHYETRPYSFFEFHEIEPSQAISYSACRLAHNVDAKLIACFSSEGRMPRRVSKFRPHEQIIGVVYSRKIAQRLALYWGVIGIKIHTHETLNEQILEATDIMREQQLLSRGEKIITTAGIPMFESGSTNSIKIHTVA